MSKNQKHQRKAVTNPHRDLPGQARLALVDYLAELTRTTKGVRPMAGKAPIADPFKVDFHPPQDSGIKSGHAIPKLKDTTKISPAIAAVRALGMGAKTAQEVATELGVSKNKIRALMGAPGVKAPSYVKPLGTKGRKVFIYTPEDVEELRAYLARERSPEGLIPRTAEPSGS